MNKNNLIRFVQSLVLLPVMTMSLSVSGIASVGVSPNVLAQKINIGTDGTLALNQVDVSEVDSNTAIIQAEGVAIDAYFTSRGMPLAGTGVEMATVADQNGIDWRLLPAIATRESTGGKNACQKVKNNPFGWDSCKVGFDSTEDAIETVAANLGGNNPTTAKHYDNKTVEEVLRAYNPPSVIPHYAEQVMAIMKDIGDVNITLTSATSGSTANT